MAHLNPKTLSVLSALLLWSSGCPGAGTKTEPTTTDSETTSTTTTQTSPTATLTQAGVQTCANPEARAAGFFERRSSAGLEASVSKLWGGGAILGDFKGDGTLQMVLTGEENLQFWSVIPGNTPAEVEFEEDAALRFLATSFGYNVGGTAIDYDADGDLDLFLTRWKLPNLLLNNDGTGHFTNATPAAMEAHHLHSQSGSWGDFDSDGDLDLFVGNYGLKPASFDDPDMPPAHPSELYENLGNGIFADISDQLPDEARDGYTFSSGWYDVDGDHAPELFIANDFGKVRPSVLVRYQDGAFVVDTGFHPNFEDMGMGVADLNGDEVPDFLMSSWKSASFMQSGEAIGAPNTWIESGDATGLTVDVDNQNHVYGWGADWADFDNDADLDALVLFGFWSTYDGPGDPDQQFDGFWEQTAPGQFEKRAAASEWQLNDSGHGRGFATGDFNQDGYLDIIKREVGANSPLYLSRCGDKHWLHVSLRHPGPNTRGIGAKVAVEANGTRQIRWITAGSTGLYGGQPPEAHFGLDTNDTIDRIEVTWPDGSQDVFDNIPSSQRVAIERLPQL